MSNVLAKYTSVEAAAAVVRFYRMDSPSTVSSVTFAHYFTKAAAECHYYGGTLKHAACQVLANLCVLQIYDTSSQACAAFRTVTSISSVVHSTPGWGTNMPWMYAEGNAANCFAQDYRKQASLESQHLKFVYAAFTMNGTFSGWGEVEDLFAYCTRAAPFNEYGAGKGSSTWWQYYGASEGHTVKCDLDLLVGKEQLFYELFLYDPKDTSTASNYLPVMVRVAGMSNDGGVTSVNAVNSTECVIS
jgi:meckelin